jgi:hypothetical protein
VDDAIVGAGAIEVNLSPDAFHRWATHYYKCYKDFHSPHKFSPVPYFLLSRAIELELKSRHLTTMRQSQVKAEFGHDISAAYLALDGADQVLDATEATVLHQASSIYASKGFEYFNPVDALSGYSKFPDLGIMDRIAVKLRANAA